jgi:hypothetical protein
MVKLLSRVRALTSALLLITSLNPVLAQGVFIGTSNTPTLPPPSSGAGVFCMVGMPVPCAGQVAFLGATTGPCAGATPGDGCAGAPAPLTAQWQRPNALLAGGYFNTLAGTSANYTNTNCNGASGLIPCSPQAYYGGINYAIGNYTLTTPGLADPATMGLPGCSYSTSTSFTGGGRVDCNTTAFEGVLQHIEWGPIGGHGCTALNISNHDPAATTLLIDDTDFFNDTGLCSVAINDNGFWINLTTTFSGGIIYSNSYADFNSSMWDTKIGGYGSAAQANPDKINFGGNTVLMKYDVIRNSSGNPLTSSTGSTNTQTIQYSWIEGWCVRGPNCHSEAYDGTGGNGLTIAQAQLGTLTFDHDVFVQSQTMSNFGPTMFWLASAYPMAILNGPNITNNILINSYAGGRPKAGITFSGCWGGSFNGTTCGAPGVSNYLFITSETGPVGYGAAVNCSGGSFVTYKSVTPTSGAIEQYIVDGFNGFQYGPAFQISASAVTCSGIFVDAHNSGNAAITATHAAAPFGSPNYSGNYVDVSSMSGAPGSQQIWQIQQADNTISVPSGRITTSGGVSTLNTSGVIAEYGAYVNGIGITGCSTNIQSCPRIAGGSGGVYTLDRSVSAIGPIAMTLVPLNWCSVSAVLNGNIDMTAQISYASLNQMSAITAGNGC